MSNTGAFKKSNKIEGALVNLASEKYVNYIYCICQSPKSGKTLDFQHAPAR